MPNDRHLRRFGDKYYLNIRVPSDVREKVGLHHVVKPLRTTNIRDARFLRDIAIGRLKEDWQRIREEPDKEPWKSLPRTLGLLAELRAKVLDNELDHEEAQEQADLIVEHHVETAYPQKNSEPQVPEANVKAISSALSALSDPDATMLSEAIAAHLADLRDRVTTQTHLQKTRRYKLLTDHFGAGVPVLNIDRKMTGRFVALKIQTHDTWSVTTRKDIVGDYSTLWRFLKVHGMAEANPWEGIATSIKGSTRGRRRSQRPWTEDELAALLSSLMPPDLLSLATIALYSGMRREEICTLTADRVKDNVFRIDEGKSAAAVRMVPVHPLIAPLVDHLIETSCGGFLLSDLKRGGQNQLRGFYIGRAFGHHVERVLKLKGVRFHDLRRNFAQSLETAGVPEATAKLLMGHTRDSLTFGLYSPGVGLDQLRASVAKVTCGPKIDNLVRERVAAPPDRS